MRYVGRACVPQAVQGASVLGERRLLSTVRELGQASAGLVAWELSLSEDEVRPAWGAAVRDGLLEPGPVDIHTGERMYGLSAAGLARLGDHDG
jgi:hypothetical protein